MKSRVEFSARALSELKALDIPTATLILGWIHKNIVGCSNPKQYGNALTSEQYGSWRYKIGEYRLLAMIKKDLVTVITINDGHKYEIPNAETLKAMDEADGIIAGKVKAKAYSTLKDAIDEIIID